MNPRLILSANATPRRGSQGRNPHHLADAIRVISRVA